MLQPGSKAPDITLNDDSGTPLSVHSLLKSGSLILYFYPADFTPGCTKEACNIRDLHGDILAVGLQVVGISPQDEASHRRFRDKHQLPFTLLADPDKVAVKAYDVDGPFGVGVRRATYLIDADATIRDALLADVRVSRHDDFIRRAVELNTGDKPDA